MSEKLIAVKKGDEILEVHPTALADHKSLGWIETDEKPKSGKSAKSDDEGSDEPKPLSKLNKKELLAEAEARGLTVAPDATNKQIVEAIEGHDAAN